MCSSSFLGNNHDLDYEIGILSLLKSYQKMGRQMSLKLNFLYSHLDFSQQIFEKLAMNKVRDYIKTSEQWK